MSVVNSFNVPKLPDCRNPGCNKIRLNQQIYPGPTQHFH